MDLTCEPDHDRRKEALVDLVFLDLESLVEMEDPVSRWDLEILGPGLAAVGLRRSVGARKAWAVNHSRVESRMV